MSDNYKIRTRWLSGEHTHQVQVVKDRRVLFRCDFEEEAEQFIEKHKAALLSKSPPSQAGEEK